MYNEHVMFFAWIKFLHSFICFQKYVEPFLFGVKEKKKSVEDTISEMNEGLKKVHIDLEKICDQQRQQPEQSNSTSKQIQELKAEIATVKGLLLSRLVIN